MAYNKLLLKYFGHLRFGLTIIAVKKKSDKCQIKPCVNVSANQDSLTG